MTIPVAVFITARVCEAKEGRGEAQGRVKETGRDGIYRSVVASQRDSSNNEARWASRREIRAQHKSDYGFSTASHSSKFGGFRELC